jgi:hypothetical protein
LLGSQPRPKEDDLLGLERHFGAIDRLMVLGGK